MNYNVPDGYVLVTHKRDELAKKFNLDESKTNLLYNELLNIAKKEGRKYKDNPNGRIWLLNEKDIDEESILKKIIPYFGEPNLFDTFEEMNNNEATIKLIKDIIYSNLETKKRLDMIRSLLEIK